MWLFCGALNRWWLVDNGQGVVRDLDWLEIMVMFSVHKAVYAFYMPIFDRSYYIMVFTVSDNFCYQRVTGVLLQLVWPNFYVDRPVMHGPAACLFHYVVVLLFTFLTIKHQASADSLLSIVYYILNCRSEILTCCKKEWLEAAMFCCLAVNQPKSFTFSKLSASLVLDEVSQLQAVCRTEFSCTCSPSWHQSPDTSSHNVSPTVQSCVWPPRTVHWTSQRVGRWACHVDTAVGGWVQGALHVCCSHFLKYLDLLINANEIGAACDPVENFI